MKQKTVSAGLILSLVVLMSSPMANAGLVFSHDNGLVVAQNTNMPFDKGTFFLDGKTPRLEIPENKDAGLVHGSWFILKSLDFGETPAMWGCEAACRIVLERESDGKKWTSLPYVSNPQDPIVSSSNGRVPRLVYSFDDTILTVAGDKYRIVFLDKSGATMNKVRYAVAEFRDGNSALPGLTFDGGGRSFAPVHAVNLAQKPQDPPKPVEPPKQAEEPKPAKPIAPTEHATQKPAKRQEPPRHVATAKPVREYPISMSIDRPKKVETTRQADDRSFRGVFYNRDVEIKSCTYTYKGKLSCNVPKDEKAEIDVEAYFVVRDIARGARDRIDGSITVGRYEFGGTNPQSQAIEFKSPAVDEIKTRTSLSGSGNKSDSSGSRYIGVIVRAMVNDKVRKVIAIPSNQKWVKIGSQEVVAFEEDKNVAKRHYDGNGSEPIVHTRIEGTGQSTPPGWMDDFYKAQELAQKDGKWMFVTFTGSDWCPPCRRLTETVLKTVRFQDALKKSGYVPVFIDSPHDQSLLSETCRKQNKDVIRMLKSSGGVPDVNIFNANGKRLACLGAATHLENGVTSYLKFFESVDKGLKLVDAVCKAHGDKGAKSQEFLKDMHTALMQIEAGTLIDIFRTEVESLVAADSSYLKSYPYFEFVAPLEKRMEKLEIEISEKTYAAMYRGKVPLNNSDERKKCKRKVFEEGKYSEKFGKLMNDVKCAETKVSQEAALDRLKTLKLRLFRAMNME